MSLFITEERIFSFILGALICGVFCYFKLGKEKRELENERQRESMLKDGSEKKVEQLRLDLKESRIQADGYIKDKIELNKALSKVEAEKSALEDKLESQEKNFKKIQETSKMQFENIANRIFEEKSKKITEENAKNINQILNPLQVNLQEFKQKVQDTYDKGAQQRIALEERIKSLVEVNQQISREATNLTNALKGSSKTQGDWGEMILENILEHSGLVKGREYFTQESFKDENGVNKRPDVKIKYPDNRYIIVDSKVSLIDYERFINCENEKDKDIHLNHHVRSLKKHIDELSAKEYDKFDKTLDFVMLFVPIEPAYLTALHRDSELWNYAYRKRILLISPTNLIAALKMVSDIWKREYQNKNTIEIVKRGEKLYDKFANLISDLEEAERLLGKAFDKQKEALRKLHIGGGNLVGQVEKLKALGINPRKNIPNKYLDGGFDSIDDSVND